MKLGDIFMPHASQLRRKFYGVADGDGFPYQLACFVHYTSAEAGLKIIQNQCMWMRNALCMADYREVGHGLDMLGRIFFKTDLHTQFWEAIHSINPSLLKAVEVFTEREMDWRTNTYVTSISEHDHSEDNHGRLSMWRGFGGYSARVALVFKVPWYVPGIDQLRVFASPVAYLPETKLVDSLKHVIASIKSNQDFLKGGDKDPKLQEEIFAHIVTMFLLWGTCLKHPGFHEEREWRALHFPTVFPSQEIKFSTETIGGVPQIVYLLPFVGALSLGKILDRVIIGPTQYPWPIASAFSSALGAIGIDAKYKIIASEIPIRT